eukprot:Gregarina_sp_Poly_1__3806@NODE_2130_length_2629_cov_36_704137_g1360_i1_p1_GENE_NODE_2130_length_2629_cov_36_704137_g1360_i1NODE_2130_length_2629_cov_36_704137_g1360_i1_p1_ORF_typecomplete_len537_score86_67AAA_13/PF13166_6/0_0068AAA_13/PF13166_6/7_1e03APG17/PF04108_12/0_025CENPB_N/PF04218_13/3e02CENPB_N/PF04218_13/3_1e02CENPB_N/PF04218_13/8_5DUF1257/PF06868_11/0_16ZapB/PF06005_12/0_22ZapB/PF06005_12/1_3e03ZapB/PF06005_12/1_3e03PP2C_C/PF07830_13/0_57PP2C_C/PF07830_13/1_8e03Phasin/PF05597_11/3e02Ph
MRSEIIQLKTTNQVLEKKLLEERTSSLALLQPAAAVSEFLNGFARGKVTPATRSTFGLEDKLQWYELQEEKRAAARHRLCIAKECAIEILLDASLSPTVACLAASHTEDNSAASSESRRQVVDSPDLEDIIKVDDSGTELSKQSIVGQSPVSSSDSRWASCFCQARPLYDRDDYKSSKHCRGVERRSKSVDFRLHNKTSGDGGLISVSEWPVSTSRHSDVTCEREANRPNSHFESIIRDQNDRISSLEEIIARRDQQVLQWAEEMATLRKEIDGSDCGELARQVNVLENRLSFALKHEANLEQELTQTIRKINQVYELESVIRKLKDSNLAFSKETDALNGRIRALSHQNGRLQNTIVLLDHFSKPLPKPLLLDKATLTPNDHWLSGSTSPMSPVESSEGDTFSPGSSSLFLGSTLSGIKGTSNWAIQRRTLYMILKKEKRLRQDAERKLSELLSSHLEISKDLQRERVRTGSQESLVSVETAAPSAETAHAIRRHPSTRRKDKADALVSFAGTKIFDFT